MKDHKTQKDEYDGYRSVARGQCRYLDGIDIKVTHTANVHMMEDGAFVDAVIWVSRESYEGFKKATDERADQARQDPPG
jgi:hypothetical protein